MKTYIVWLAVNDSMRVREITVRASSDRHAYKLAVLECRDGEHVRAVIEDRPQ